MPGYSGDLEAEMDGGKKKTLQKKTQKPKQKVHTGPRGGKYVVKKGKKVYL